MSLVPCPSVQGKQYSAADGYMLTGQRTACLDVGFALSHGAFASFARRAWTLRSGVWLRRSSRTSNDRRSQWTSPQTRRPRS